MIDYGLLALFSIQLLIAIAVAVVFVRLLTSVQRIRESELSYKHSAETTQKALERLELSYERHKKRISEMMEKKLDFELQDDKIKAELKRLSSRLTYISKQQQETQSDDVIEIPSQANESTMTHQEEYTEPMQNNNSTFGQSAHMGG